MSCSIIVIFVIAKISNYPLQDNGHCIWTMQTDVLMNHENKAKYCFISNYLLEGNGHCLWTINIAMLYYQF